MSYLMTKELKGIMLCDEYYENNPEKGINVLIEAFNALYNIDYSDCTIDETIDVKIKRAIESKCADIDEKVLNRSTGYFIKCSRRLSKQYVSS